MVCCKYINSKLHYTTTYQLNHGAVESNNSSNNNKTTKVILRTRALLARPTVTVVTPLLAFRAALFLVTAKPPVLRSPFWSLPCKGPVANAGALFFVGCGACSDLRVTLVMSPGDFGITKCWIRVDIY